MTEVEDLYLPYKPKRRTKATIARERGLEPLANMILAQEPLEKPLNEIINQYINPEKQLTTAEDVVAGAIDIIAEEISNNIEIRNLIRNVYFEKARLIAKKSPLFEDELQENKVSEEKLFESTKFEKFFEFEDIAVNIPPHRLLALNRGEKEGFLYIKVEFEDKAIIEEIKNMVIKDETSEFADILKEAVEQGYKRLLAPSLKRELRKKITETAEKQAIKVFSENLRNLLLTPPLKDKVIMGIDPAYRTGCKVAVIDQTSKLLETATIYPHEPQNKKVEAKKILASLIEKHNVDVIAIGNGTASRETEFLVAELLSESFPQVQYAIVNEAGASVYSASDIAREEFPDLDVAMRGAVSIARRLQDPLAEYVKIDPRSIGVGQYQHDIKGLKEALDTVVESVVNTVGVNLNTASYSLLKYVSGITRTVAKRIIEYRNENGKFKGRSELLKVKRLGEHTFLQCAGFLRIPDSQETPLDNTPVHPESYNIAIAILKHYNFTERDLLDEKRRMKLQAHLKNCDPMSLAKELGFQEKQATVEDIIQVLQSPFRDPREDFPAVQLRKDVLTLDDLKEDMILEGTVTNVTDFGAFVDIGVKVSGLIHISQLANSFVRHPSEIVKVGDIVKVRVLSVDKERKRISLSLKIKSEEAVQAEETRRHTTPKPSAGRKTDKPQYKRRSFTKKPRKEERILDELYKKKKIRL